MKHLHALRAKSLSQIRTRLEEKNMKKKITYAIFAVCLLIGGAFIIGTVSAQRASKAKKPDGAYTRDGKYLAADGKPVESTWCYPGTWTSVPSSDPPRWTCKGGSVYGTGHLAGPGAPE